MVWKSISESLTIQKRTAWELEPQRRVTRTRYKSLLLKDRGLPLHFAICNKLSAEVRCLIEGGSNVDAQDLYKRTPLMLCCIENDEGWSTGVAMMLLQAGANAALCDANGRNALMFAVVFLRRNIIDLLLSAVDYNMYQRDAKGKTALHYALLRCDEVIIRRITDACKRGSKTPILGCIQKDAQKYAFLPHRSTPPEPCKAIMQEEKSNNQIHLSSSDMNVHQFRRRTMRKFSLQSSMRATSASVDTLSASSPSISLITFNRQRYIHSAARLHSKKNKPAPSSVSSREFKRYKDSNSIQTWKTSVPAMWHILTIQCCPSYRQTVTPSFQTFEEALGLPTADQEDNVVLGADQETLADTSNAPPPPRRSSMPTPSSPPHLGVTGRVDRRRSEACVGISAASLSKLLLNEQKIAKRIEVLGELHQANETVDSQIGLRKKSKTDEAKKDNKETISVDDGPPQSALSSSKSRTEIAIVKRSTRTFTTRNGPGSALRQQPSLLQKPSREESIPAIKVNNGQYQQASVMANTDTLDTTAPPPNQSAAAPASDIAQNIRNEKSGDQEDLDQNPTKDTRNEEQSSPRRTPRRQSILLRDSVLADILEENESHANLIIPGTRSAATPRLSAGAIRCASAYVRGNGRRNTR